METIIFEKICEQCSLGSLKSNPRQLKGGYMHKMYSLSTTNGRYAVKLLNPYIMERKTAKENFSSAEKIELILEQNSIPILPALKFNHKKMQNIEGQFYYVYDWYDGKALSGNNIRKVHCEKIGQILAKIHQLDFRQEPYIREKLRIDWDDYIEKLDDKNKELCNLLQKNRALLYESQNKGNAAIKRIPSMQFICHNDMDSKNVLWIEDEYRIIDLECLSYGSSVMELYELALCWSGYEECNINYELFDAFIASYIETGGQLSVNADTLYDSNYGRLEWLEYNIKRTLGIECSVDEIEIGIM